MDMITCRRRGGGQGGVGRGVEKGGYGRESTRGCKRAASTAHGDVDTVMTTDKR